MALGTTRPPIQWVNWDLPTRARRPKPEADYSSPSCDDAKSEALNP
jgi:hypothetical protein